MNANAVPVLLFEAAPSDRLIVEATGAQSGCRVVTAPAGEAVERAAATDFAAIVIDLGMPTALDSARALRAQPRSRATPIVFIADADRHGALMDEALGLGAVDFLTRPLLPALVKARLAWFVERQASAAQPSVAVELAHERAFLAAVLEAIEDGIVACNAEGVLTLFNRATREMHGLPNEPMPAEGWVKRYGLYRADGVTPMAIDEIPLWRAFQGERLRDAELVVAPVGGKPRALLASGGPIVDASGRKLGAVISMHDVTARREAEAAHADSLREQARAAQAQATAQRERENRERLEASQERLRLACEAAELGIWVWDMASDRVTWENDRPYAMFGMALTEEPVSARRFIDEFLHPDDAPIFTRAVDAMMTTGAPLHMRGRMVRRGDGDLRWIELNGVLRRRDDGTPSRVIGTAADITERKRAEEALLESEQRYRTLFETIDEGFCIIEMLYDPAGTPWDYRFLEINPSFAAMSGLQGVVGKTMRELVPDHDPHWFEAYGRVAATGEPMRFENEAKALGRWFDVFASRVGGPGSARVAVVFNDISVRKHAEAELRRLAADLSAVDRRKTEFLAILAHELRNPLAPLRTGLYVLRHSRGGPGEVAKVREMMERQLGHMVHLIDDLMDVARISRGKIDLKKQPVTLDTVVGSAVETSLPLIEASGHSLTIDLPREPLWLELDPVRMAQVFANLLNNAAKYTRSGGSIAVSAQREGDQAVVRVTDDGIGIPAESLCSVFEMFSQVGRNLDRAQGGLGIGLTLVRRLVELHGGTVDARSAGADRGSTFCVRLPLATGPVEGAAAAAADPTRADPASAGPRRVMVVDDNADAAESLASLLRIEGHATLVAYDGDQALREAPGFGPDLVFLDIGMPGTNGYEVARALRSMHGLEGATIVALSGWGADHDRELSRAAGFDHHLTKPFDIERVYDLLAQRS